MTDLVPLILASLLAGGLIVGIVLFWRMMNEPWDEWDAESGSDDDARVPDKKD